MASTVILAQASLSRLGESSWNSPWFCSNFSLRRPTLVLSDALSCSGENGSLKREWLAQASPRGNQLCPLLASSSRQGTLVLGEMVSPKQELAECHCCRSRSGEDA